MATMKEDYNNNELDNKPINDENDNNDNPQKPAKKTASWNAYFGVFMVLVYFGMAYLTLGTNYFFWIHDWARYSLGTIFIVYGLWRGYRYYKSF